MMPFIRLNPIYQDRIWGGSALASDLGRSLPPGRSIGESWDIVDRPEAQSTVVTGRFAGMTLRQLIEQEPGLMGPRWVKHRPFPILVKWLDCQQRLSLQVHPPASVAEALKGEPKTENWYIADCAPGSHLIVGLKSGVTRAQFEQAISNFTLEDLIHRFPVRPGDSILVQSGRLHAIDGGNLVLEIQQNSDTTYRVYDWGRLGADGKPRQMHVAESLRSIRWDDFEPQPVRGDNTTAVIAEAAEFRIRRVPLSPKQRLKIVAEEETRILSVVSGSLLEANSGENLARGENVILPFDGEFIFEAEDAAMLLLTEKFS